MSTTSILLALVLILMPAAAVADAAEDGRAAFAAGDFGRAMELWKPPAESGDPRAQYALAQLYLEGKGVPQNYTIARQWLEEAADQGHVEAQFALGELYEQGLGGRREPFRAAEWYRLAVRWGGHSESAFRLGLMSFSGNGAPQNYATAISWFRVAADQGHALAQYLLGSMFERGWGVRQNPVEAFKWFALSAHYAGGKKLTFRRETYDPVRARDTIKSRLSGVQLEEAGRILRSWKPAG